MPDALDGARLAAGLKTPVRLLARCTSTNALAREMGHAGAPHSQLVVAEHQTAGRGRQGRTWDAKPGENLLFSLLLRPPLPPRDAPLLCLAAAVALAETLDLGIKWPNDLLDPQERKVSGILAEMEARPGRLAFVVLGVGVNVNQAAFPPELPRAASLAMRDGPQDRTALLLRVVPAILARCAQLQADRVGVLDAWRGRAVTLGRRVRVGAVEGVARALQEDGGLVVDTAQGPRVVLAGDVEMVG
ncbi:MAG: biotin--[acetyl-CoA-carboxylase] ligase [Alphaproteobacteria bacterium]|nr:biotin--[acetyl-CoA-carboxylase] ligase [Alphaproteobacteria bacterium]